MVKYTISNSIHEGTQVPLSEELFEWCIENLIRNAVDAMSGNGELSLVITQSEKHILLDVCDTGKGIARSKFSSVFNPGYTTKSRGWGLGLSLTKRIIEDFHKGRIFVKASELGHGTTFRILLPKSVTNRK